MTDEIDPADVPAWPVVGVEMRTDGQVRVDGETFAVPDGADVRQAAITAVATTASLIGRPVRAEAREPDGTVWPLIVTPDGQAIAAGAGRRPAPTAKRRGVRGGVLRRSAAAREAPAPQPPPSTITDAVPASEFAPPQGPPVPLPPPAPRTSSGLVPTDDAPSPEPVDEAGPQSARAQAPFPAPDTDTRAALDRILAELRNKRLAAARSRAQALVDRLTGQRHRDDPAVVAAREVLAYTMFVAGDAARAALLYADLATPRVAIPTPADSDVARLADNAHFCWHRSAKSPENHEIGARIIALRKAGWGGDSGPARNAQHRLTTMMRQAGR